MCVGGGPTTKILAAPLSGPASLLEVLLQNVVVPLRLLTQKAIKLIMEIRF